MENVILLNDYFERTIEEIQSMGIEFDYVVCSSLLHELDEPDKLLKAIYELCSEQTIVNIIVPNAKSVHRLLAHCMGMIPDIYCKSEMQTIMQQSDVVYDTDSLGERCRKNGFKVIDSGSFFVKFFSHKQMQACLDNGIFDETLLEGLDKLVEYMPEYGSEIWVELVKRMTKEI
jgi:2-polyprenyl-3-methyl-5-hydroxy-6-metoxy-1,4-benzoquinol methylase